MTQLRIGTLGAARITPMALIRPAHKTPDVAVTVVAARDPGRAAQFASKHSIPIVHEDYDSLLSDPDVDAIYNPLPNGLHAEWTLRAIEAGKHVLCEKPFTSNAAQAREVHDADARSDRVVMEAFHYRYHPLAQRLHDLVASRELGALEFLETWMCIPLPIPGDIRYRLDLAGGATMDTGCYAVHLARTVSGEEPRVESAKAKLASEGVDRAMEVEVSYPSGAHGRIHCSLFSSKFAKVGVRARLEGGEIRCVNPIVPHFFHRLRWRRHGERWNKEAFPKKATYEYQLDAFRDAVLHDKPFVTTTADAVKTMAVIDSVYIAAGMSPRS